MYIHINHLAMDTSKPRNRERETIVLAKLLMNKNYKASCI